jgi:hypothetical protein
VPENQAPYGNGTQPPAFCPFRHIAYPAPSLDPREIALKVTDLGCPGEACHLWDATAKACALKLAALTLRLIGQLLKDTTATLFAVLDELKP